MNREILKRLIPNNEKVLAVLKSSIKLDVKKEIIRDLCDIRPVDTAAFIFATEDELEQMNVVVKGKFNYTTYQYKEDHRFKVLICKEEGTTLSDYRGYKTQLGECYHTIIVTERFVKQDKKVTLYNAFMKLIKQNYKRSER